jgi:FkbM family methyltransferase
VKQVNGFWLPDGEEHLVSFLENGPQFAGGPSYQLHKLMAAMPLIRNFRHAVDVGGHCGLWARPMAACFGGVTAFEPVVNHRACFERNMKWFEVRNVTLFPYALGDHEGNVSLHTGESSSGDTYVKEGGEHSAQMKTLDSFELKDVDFLKLDCEGYEYFALRGGEHTIKRDKPCIVVEQKPGKGSQFGLADTVAVTLLVSWGAEVVKEISGDFICRWK